LNGDSKEDTPCGQYSLHDTENETAPVSPREPRGQFGGQKGR